MDLSQQLHRGLDDRLAGPLGEVAVQAGPGLVAAPVEAAGVGDVADVVVREFEHVRAEPVRLQREYGKGAACIAEWQAWLKSADQLRCKRNDLMHGRWGINELRGLVSNVVGLPGLANQAEVTYSLEELNDEIDAAATVADRFSELSGKWPA